MGLFRLVGWNKRAASMKEVDRRLKKTCVMGPMISKDKLKGNKLFVFAIERQKTMGLCSACWMD